MKRILLSMVAVALLMPAHAQFFDRLVNSARNSAENAVERKVNQKLSEQRAQAIVNKLVEMGIAANRLTAKGMGQSAPLADNSTDEGCAKNRRVEFVKK